METQYVILLKIVASESVEYNTLPFNLQSGDILTDICRLEPVLTSFETTLKLYQ